MFHKTFLGSARTADGYFVRMMGRNIVLLKKGRVRYFAFYEFLATEPLSVQLDTTGVWTDDKLKHPLTDIALRDDLLRKAEAYFAFVGIGVEK